MPKNNERMIMYLLAAAVLVLAYVLAFRQKKESFGTEVLKLVPPESMRGPVPKGKFREEDWIDLRPFPHQKSGEQPKLHTYRSIPDDDRNKEGVKHPEKGVVFIWHGWNEHVGRSAHVAERLFQEGYHVYGLDYRGFGKSEGLRGYISDFDLLMDDVEHYVNVVLRSYPDDVKVFAFGQSLGGASALHLALRMPDILDGILMLAPAIKQNGDLQPLMQLLARVVGYLLPTLEITKLPAGLGCRNPASNEDFYDDPLNHKGYIHAGTGYALLQQCQYLQENMHTLKVPFLCLHGTLDKMVDPTGAHMLVEHAKHLRKEEKELKFYEGVWHDLIHDPEYEMVLDDCVQWMADRTEFSSN